MIDELRAMAIFAETARHGSFRAAAKVLGLSPSVVSYHITQLEQGIGNALIYRSTRKISLTSEGEVLYQYAQQMLTSAQQGLSKVRPDAHEPTGRLTVAIPSVLSRAPITRRIAEFAKSHPKVAITVSATDVRQNLIEESIDLAIRVGRMDDSSLKSKRLGEVQRKLVCSRDYLADRPVPNGPKDLKSWDWIRLAMLPTSRVLIDSKNKKVSVTFEPQTTVNSVELMTQLCVHGLGLATPPAFLVEEELMSGSLVEILPQWRVEPIPIFAVWPPNVTENSNARRFLNFLIGAS